MPVCTIRIICDIALIAITYGHGVGISKIKVCVSLLSQVLFAGSGHSESVENIVDAFIVQEGILSGSVSFVSIPIRIVLFARAQRRHTGTRGTRTARCAHRKVNITRYCTASILFFTCKRPFTFRGLLPEKRLFVVFEF